MKTILVIMAVLVAAALVAGCATTPPSSTPTPTPTTPVTTSPGPGMYTIQTASTPQLGTYLTNANGLALYYFARDIPSSGTTACNTSACLSLWTLFTPNTISVSPPLQASDFGTIPVSGGNQVTYKGWPLYLYNADTRGAPPGGDNFGNIWYVMKPDYSVMIMENSRDGAYLADESGKTLYVFTADSTGKSVCTNSSSVLVQGKTCLQFWPVFYTESLVVPSALKTSDFSNVTRSDGMEQIGFRGRPLYYFLADSKPGDVNGQGINGFGGYWYVISPAGVIPTPTPTTLPMTTVATTTTPPSGGYSGY